MKNESVIAKQENKVVLNHSFFSSISECFKNNKIAGILLLLAYSSTLVNLATLPSFTYRSGYNIASIVLSVVNAVFILLYLLVDGRFAFNTSIISYLLFVIYDVLLTLITTRDFEYTKTTVNLFLLLFVLFLFFTQTKQVGFFHFAFISGILVLATWFIIFYKDDILIFAKSSERLGSEFGNLNQVGFCFSLGIIDQMSLIYTKGGRCLFYSIPVSLALLFLTAITVSKGAIIISFLAIIISMFLLSEKKKKTWVFVLSILIAVILLFVLLQIPYFDSIRERFYQFFSTFFSSTTSSSRDSSTLQRLNMFSDGLQIWLKNLFFGTGSGGFASLTNYGSYSHSNVAEVLSCFGIIGFILFYGPGLLCFKNALKNKASASRCLVITTFICVFCVYSFFGMIYFSKITMLFWTLSLVSDFLANKKNESFALFSITGNGFFVHLRLSS